MIQRIDDPHVIARRSFEMIRQELRQSGIHLQGDRRTIVERIIHSTADFDFAKITQFSADAIGSGLQALQSGCPIITDVNMVRVGIGSARVAKFGGALHCFVTDPAARQWAEHHSTTRSAAGIQIAHANGLLQRSIVVVGNAPTALFETLSLSKKGVLPSLIVGVPVGFIGAVESKDKLMANEHVDWISTGGRKGGSAVAVAIVNALLRMAAGEDQEIVD